ncbi:type IV toxin-antitoxin system AbiEi family antitoxin domain-containing protein [Agathobacter sp.]
MNEQEVQSLIQKAMDEHNGVVKKEELTKLGIDYRRVNQLVKDGKLARIKNGYYTDRVDGFSEEALVAALFPDAKLCMESALYAYGYIKEKPFGWTLAVDKNTSKSRFKMDYPKIIPFYTEPEALEIGAATIEISGSTFGIYDKERMICDCLKYESKMNRDDFKAAIQSYIADPDKDISVLMDYARARKVVKKVQSLIGVWL